MKNGRWGIIDERKNVLVPPILFKIDKMHNYENLIMFSDSSSAKGIYSFKNELVLKSSPGYKRIELAQKRFCWIYNEENKVAAFNYNDKKFVSKFEFDRVEGFLNDTLLIVVIKNLKGLYNINQKKKLLECNYQEIKSTWEEYVGGGSVSNVYLNVTKSNKSAVYNLKKKIFVSDFIFDEIVRVYPDKNISVVKDKKFKLYGLKEKRYLSELSYTHDFQYINDYIYVVGNRDELQSLYNFKIQKYLIKDKSSIRELQVGGAKRTDYVCTTVSELEGVFSIILNKQIINEEYARVYMSLAEPNSSGSKVNSKIVFSCSSKRYSDRNLTYFDTSGRKITLGELSTAGLELEGYYGRVGSEAMDDYDDSEEDFTIRFKKSREKEFKVVRNKFPKDTFKIVGYDTIMTFSLIALKDRERRFRYYHRGINDTILLARKSDKLQLITYKGKLAFDITFDSLSILIPHKNDFLYSDFYLKTTSYYKDGKIGIIKFGEPFWVSEPILINLSRASDYSFSNSYIMGSTGPDNAFILNVTKGEVYHPDIQLPLINKIK